MIPVNQLRILAQLLCLRYQVQGLGSGNMIQNPPKQEMTSFIRYTLCNFFFIPDTFYASRIIT